MLVMSNNGLEIFQWFISIVFAIEIVILIPFSGNERIRLYAIRLQTFNIFILVISAWALILKMTKFNFEMGWGLVNFGFHLLSALILLFYGWRIQKRTSSFRNYVALQALEMITDRLYVIGLLTTIF